ncbi:hypothetical protein F5882DRAFT_471566 [Hyaloscypha sp. PMI_1271]|nr:hypothetical protein F5882DRAFT_471566 [Hyaloscypha sp. PMI_1271]
MTGFGNLMLICCWTVCGAVVAAIQSQDAIWKRSFHLGVAREKRESPYSPATSVCGPGKTCDQACGSGFEQCVARDTFFHCFDPMRGQTCCKDNTGFACDSGYYCAYQSTQRTLCCPNNLNLGECAKSLGVNTLMSAIMESTTSMQLTLPPTTTTVQVTVTAQTTSSTPGVAIITPSGPLINVTNYTATPTPYTGDGARAREYFPAFIGVMILAIGLFS